MKSENNTIRTFIISLAALCLDVTFWIRHKEISPDWVVDGCMVFVGILSLLMLIGSGIMINEDANH